MDGSGSLHRFHQHFEMSSVSTIQLLTPSLGVHTDEKAYLPVLALLSYQFWNDFGKTVVETIKKPSIKVKKTNKISYSFAPHSITMIKGSIEKL